MSTFWATSQIDERGNPRLNFGDRRDKFAADLKKNPNAHFVGWVESNTP